MSAPCVPAFAFVSVSVLSARAIRRDDREEESKRQPVRESQASDSSECDHFRALVNVIVVVVPDSGVCVRASMQVSRFERMRI